MENEDKTNKLFVFDADSGVNVIGSDRVVGLEQYQEETVQQI